MLLIFLDILVYPLAFEHNIVVHLYYMLTSEYQSHVPNKCHKYLDYHYASSIFVYPIDRAFFHLLAPNVVISFDESKHPNRSFPRFYAAGNNLPLHRVAFIL